MGGGVAAGILVSRMLNQKNGSNNDGLKDIADKLDDTNELLNELLRSQARLEGILSSSYNK